MNFFPDNFFQKFQNLILVTVFHSRVVFAGKLRNWQKSGNSVITSYSIHYTKLYDEKLIVSERAASSEKEKEVISKLDVNDIVEGEISGVVDFGAFIKFMPPYIKDGQESDKLEGLVHISELAWQLIQNPRDVVKTGDKVRAKIIGIDETRISVITSYSIHYTKLYDVPISPTTHWI